MHHTLKFCNVVSLQGSEVIVTSSWPPQGTLWISKSKILMDFNKIPCSGQKN